MEPVRCDWGMVVGPHPNTAEAGLEMLRAGGNAFDAAVAAAFTEGVVQPAHNGVAGYGGAAVCYLAAERRVACVDFNTEAPRAAHAEMYDVQPGAGVFAVRDALHKRGARSIGIPGVVAGLEEIHRTWGSLPLSTVLAPAIRAARDGWPCNRVTRARTLEHLKAMRESFPETAELLAPGGRAARPGELLRNPEMADTLAGLARDGLRDFYEGRLAARLVESLRTQGGILTGADFAGYRARHVLPTTMAYEGRDLHTAPVGCGGVTSFQMLRVLAEFDVTAHAPDSAEFYHLFAEVMKACWRRRLRTLGDPAFTGAPEAAELEPAVIAALAEEVRPHLDRASQPEPFAPDPFQCTSHLCAADTAGNVVSLTQTHGAAFGSWVSVPGTGLIFGHGMARFDPRPGWPNSIAPGKRPLHNMAPMLVTRAGRPVAAYGTPGGRTIVNNQAYFTLAQFAYGLDIEAAVTLPRLHCEEAEPVLLEYRIPAPVRERLREMGHRVDVVEQNGGAAHGITFPGPGLFDGATDPRNEGKVAFA
jgi:gamma-glutamyltranspeptidase/glutathione hydrolase